MKNEPQLTAEMKKRLLDLLPLGLDDWIVEDIKHFLATAIEEQRMQTEVKTGLNAFGVTMEEIAKARADERKKVLEEVEEAYSAFCFEYDVPQEIVFLVKIRSMKGNK